MECSDNVSFDTNFPGYASMFCHVLQARRTTYARMPQQWRQWARRPREPLSRLTLAILTRMCSRRWGKAWQSS